MGFHPIPRFRAYLGATRPWFGLRPLEYEGLGSLAHATHLNRAPFPQKMSSHDTHTLPQHFHGIVSKDRIMADEDGLFSVGLGDQEPIKRVLVVCWEAL